jgi:hypothetical protein
VICRTAGGYVIYGADGGCVICRSGRGGDGWLWHSCMIDSMSEVGLGFFCVFVVEKVKDKIVSITSGRESTTGCGLLLLVVVVVKVEQVLALFSSWF